MQKNIFLPALLLSAVMFFSGCTGSDSGGGSTSKARITSNNASDITESAFQANTSMVTGSSAVAGELGRSSDEKNLPAGKNLIADLDFQILDFINESGILSSAQTRSRFQVDDFYGTKNGLYGGTATYTLSRQGQTFRAIITFNDYSSYPEEYLDGSLTLNGKANPADDSLSGNAEITFNSLRIVYSNHFDCTVSGTMTMQTQGSGMIFTSSATIRDELRNKTSKVENYVVEMKTENPYIYYDISGAFSHSTYGEVEISTSRTFIQKLFEDHPSEGILIVEGAAGTMSRLTVIDSETYIIEADLNGDGAFEWTSGTRSWDSR